MCLQKLESVHKVTVTRLFLGKPGTEWVTGSLIKENNKECLVNKKNMLVSAFAATFVIVIAGIVAMVVLYFQPKTVIAKSVEPVSNYAESSTVVNVPSLENSNAAEVKYPLAQEINGIKMEVTGTAMEGEYFTTDVCYDLPAPKTGYEFTLGGQTQKSIALTNAKNETIMIYSWKIIGGFNQDANGNFQGNCARLYFPVLSDTNLDGLTLTISRMSTPVADFPDCEKAQQKLDEAKQKIKVECYENGGFGVSEKPDDMSDQEAREIALEAFIEIVEGPWVFKLK